MKKNHPPQFWIALGAVVLSLVTLFGSMRQTTARISEADLLHDEARADYWPSLDISLSLALERDSLRRYVLLLENSGRGTAFIEATEVYYDNLLITSWSDLATLAGLPGPPQAPLLARPLLKAGDRITWLDLQGYPELMRWLYARHDELEVRICYRSSFGDHWIIERRGFDHTRPARIRMAERCLERPDRRFGASAQQ